MQISIVAPHWAGRRKPKAQACRALRRYARRWKVQRLFVWLQNYRRLITRFERKIENCLAFLNARGANDFGKEVFMRYLLMTS